MNDIEKAINVISNLKHLIINIIGNEINEKEFDTTISALEKQMPKKIKKFTYPKNIVYMYCPECDEGIDENNLFCSRCGQKIDWEVENELSTHKHTSIRRLY